MGPLRGLFSLTPLVALVEGEAPTDGLAVAQYRGGAKGRPASTAGGLDPACNLASIPQCNDAGCEIAAALPQESLPKALDNLQ